jgi:hypothetical protein
VKLDKLLKKLKRDITASPQKAAALGLMVLVALYFWAPLVLKFAGGKTKSKKVAASQVILTDDPILTKVAAHPAIDSTRWDRVRHSITQDRLMLAVAHRAEWRDPFQRLSIESKSEESKNETEAAPQPESRAESPVVDEAKAQELIAGITISTLLIGKRDSAALIRGTVYRVGDTIQLDDEKGERDLELRVVSIDPDGVVLEHRGKKFRIERPRPKVSPGDHVKQH